MKSSNSHSTHIPPRSSHIFAEPHKSLHAGDKKHTHSPIVLSQALIAQQHLRTARRYRYDLHGGGHRSAQLGGLQLLVVLVRTGCRIGVQLRERRQLLLVTIVSRLYPCAAGKDTHAPTERHPKHSAQSRVRKIRGHRNWIAHTHTHQTATQSGLGGGDDGVQHKLRITEACRDTRQHTEIANRRYSPSPAMLLPSMLVADADGVHSLAGDAHSR